MASEEEARLVRSAASSLYENGQAIWIEDDPWNAHKRRSINSFGQKYAQQSLASASKILDAGCGSQPYDWLPPGRISLDRFWLQARTQPLGVAGDVERLPFAAETFDFVVCVAAVIDYVSAAEAISELTRVLRPGGQLLLHYETSTSFEHLATPRWRRPVSRLSTVNNGKRDVIWVYNPTYINSIIQNNDLVVLHEKRFHVISTLGLRLGLPQRMSARLAVLDRFLSPHSRFADDVILLAVKS